MVYRIRNKQRIRRQAIKHWLIVGFCFFLLFLMLWGSWYLTKVTQDEEENKKRVQETMIEQLR